MLESSQFFLKPREFISVFHHPFTAWVVLFLSLCLTLFAYFIAESFVDQRLQDRFDFETEEISLKVIDRLNLYEQVLWGGVGFINASEHVDRMEFAEYIETLNINQHWPGIQGIGYSIPIDRDQVQQHEREIRAEGFPDYQINPEGEREYYTSIIYLEPLDWRNQRAFGYDMWTNPMRREAMARARDQGVAATSGIITLVQETDEDVQNGFLTYLPVYESGTNPDTVAERQRFFKGWIYAPFRAGNLIREILGSERLSIDLEIYDGTEKDTDKLLFDSNEDNSEQFATADYSKVKTIKLQGRAWQLFFQASEHFGAGLGANQPLYVAAAGTLVDLLLFYLIYSLYLLNKKMQQITEERDMVIDQAPNALIMVNQQGRIVLINAQADQLFGYDTGELVDKPIDLLVPDYYKKDHPRQRQDYFKAPASKSMGAGRDLSGLRKNGSLVPVEIGLSPITSVEGTFVIAAVVDISERLRHQQTLENINQKLEQKNKEMEQFIYTVSHDLKSPLVAMGGFASSLNTELIDVVTERQAHRLRRISANVAHMENLLNDLLQLSRVIQQGIEKKAVDVEEVMAQVTTTLEQAVNDADAGIEIQKPLLPVYTTESLLYQCLQNILGNAIQYRDPHRKLKITVSTTQVNSSIKLQIKDTGIGIAAKYHDRIFQIFERLQTGEGTGVGLAIVKTIMEKHGGAILLESVEGVGSVFTLLFPNHSTGQVFK